MRACPRCRVPMKEEVRKFATLDLCPQCGGMFVELGEGITALGHATDLSDLTHEGRAEMVGPSPLSCPGQHGFMVVYRLQRAAGRLELDLCPTCAGVFFEAGEAEVFKQMVAHAGEIVSASGARFSAPPVHDAAVAAVREERGGTLLGAIAREKRTRYPWQFERHERMMYWLAKLS